jgi:hypothetical protein
VDDAAEEPVGEPVPGSDPVVVVPVLVDVTVPTGTPVVPSPVEPDPELVPREAGDGAG